MTEVKANIIASAMTGSREAYSSLVQLVDSLVEQAYIAGAEGTKGIGLNYTNAERADMYCKDKGLRT